MRVHMCLRMTFLHCYKMKLPHQVMNVLTKGNITPPWYGDLKLCIKNPIALEMCISRKNPYPPHRRSLEIPKGRGVLKVKILEAKYEAKLEFPLGGGKKGVKEKTFCGGSMDIFWNCTIPFAKFIPLVFCL